mmetsp:Transcript_36025/g.69995  ORF Transcript_36025/g.69995 Transcript_36025/m.69995 type:complete len:213 (+) Transcript_36025:114-752(+)
MTLATPSVGGALKVLFVDGGVQVPFAAEKINSLPDYFRIILRKLCNHFSDRSSRFAVLAIGIEYLQNIGLMFLHAIFLASIRGICFVHCSKHWGGFLVTLFIKRPVFVLAVGMNDIQVVKYNSGEILERIYLESYHHTLAAEFPKVPNNSDIYIFTAPTIKFLRFVIRVNTDGNHSGGVIDDVVGVRSLNFDLKDHAHNLHLGNGLVVDVKL